METSFVRVALILAFVSACAVAGTIETIAGNGDPSHVGQPFGVEIGPDGALYVCDVENHVLHRVDLNTGESRIVAGNGRKGYSGDGGPATEASMNEPYEVRFDRSGNIYIVERLNHLIRRIDHQTGIITTIAGTGRAGFGGDGGPATQATFSQPHSIAIDDERGHLYVADIINHRIRRIDLNSGIVETVAGTGERKLPTDGAIASGKPMLGPRALFIEGRRMWIALREGNSIWVMDLDSGKLRHIGGTGKAGFSGDGGPALKATMNGPKGVAVHDGSVYLVDTESQVIRRVNLASGRIDTIAGAGPKARGYGGDGGTATEAKLDRPHGICIGPDGAVYIGDTNNHRVRRVK